MTESRKVAVIGGGISGLACVFKLLEMKEKSKADLEILLFEKSGRLGGTIETDHQDGFLIEKGPDSFISEKPFAVDLCRRLGIENEILGTRNEHRRSFVLHRNRLIALPEGFYLIAPTLLTSFLKSPLFSWPGKMRMIFEPLVPRRSAESDESVGGFIRRRFGKEALERVGQPMIGGIHTGDPESLSMEATMPRFKEMEKKYGSVTRGLLAKLGKKDAHLDQARGPRYSLFLSFREGMETLTKKLAGKVPAGYVHLGSEIKETAFDPSSGKWRIIFSNGEVRIADAVCATIPAGAAARLLKNFSPTLSEKLGSISYESVATVNLGYRSGQIAHALDGFGFVVPRTEGTSLVACSFSSRKFSDRASEGDVLLRAFVGGAFGKKYFEMVDQELLKNVSADLSKILGIKGEAVFASLKRYPDSMVQYRVGHLQLVTQIEDELKRSRGLFLTGSSYRGVGIPDCIADAENTAEKIFDRLNVKG